MTDMESVAADLAAYLDIPPLRAEWLLREMFDTEDEAELVPAAVAWCIEHDIPLRQFAYEYS